MALRNLKYMQHAIRQCNHQTPVFTTHVREIKKWVRPVILSFQSRKKQVERQMIYPPKESPRSGFSDWNYNSEIFAFSKRLGEHFDDSLLRTALTDSTYLTVENARREELGLMNLEELQGNEGLAVDGKHLVNKTITTVLAEEFPLLPKEGIITLCKILTDQKCLAEISFLIGTKDLILSDDHPPSEEVYCRTLYAIIAALEKSSGLEKATKFIVDIIMTQLIGKDILELLDPAQPWTLLLDTMKQRGQDAPEPRLLGQAGQHTILSAYYVGLYDSDKKLLGKGFGETLDIAHEQAAKDVLRDLYDLRRPKNGFNFLKTQAAANNKTKKIEQSKQKSFN